MHKVMKTFICRGCVIPVTSTGHTHTTILPLVWNMSGSTRVSRYQKSKTKKVKTNLDLLEQEIGSGSGICWAICKSAPHADNHANIPPFSFFTGRMPFLTPNQQRQSTEGIKSTGHTTVNIGSMLHGSEIWPVRKEN